MACDLVLQTTRFFFFALEVLVRMDTRLPCAACARYVTALSLSLSGSASPAGWVAHGDRAGRHTAYSVSLPSCPYFRIDLAGSSPAIPLAVQSNTRIGERSSNTVWLSSAVYPLPQPPERNLILLGSVTDSGNRHGTRQFFLMAAIDRRC